ncbi:MAG: tryptophan--tRNA ligase [Lentisphaeria bacterium]|nr:tryptophan--tRNA ligase [Lentisphaerota bacterium]MBO5202009.1 tryptophan--tRNA ligase [Lentisphaeria bacterium]MBO5694308.1 tryptophan--tRNA ligase [Lentisphaeria bacterium]MBR4885586.1 tryptophan--tRNA ligase [Lentisphaeria bacterium]
MEQKTAKKRILTGVQPSGILHIGNYFGAISASVKLQEEADESFLFIADFHSLTVNPDPDALRERVKQVALDFLACGIDPAKTLFFRQSDVPEVCELSWILNCITGVGLLERAHSYKDKIAKGFSPNNGLFSYPVLMAADILLYKSTLVPVGKDQKQHLEITRDIAIRFNQMYGETLVVPDGYINTDVAVVPGLDGQKMSKSYNNTIEIFGNPKAIRKKIMGMPTDCKTLEEPKDPDTCNVFALYKLFSTKAQQEEMAERYRAGNYGYGHAKQALFDAYMDFFAPMRKRREELEADPGYVESVLKTSAEKAKAVAQETLLQVQKAVGLR